MTNIILFPDRPAMRGWRLWHQTWESLQPAHEERLPDFWLRYYFLQNDTHSFLVIHYRNTTVTAFETMKAARERFEWEVENDHPTARAQATWDPDRDVLRHAPSPEPHFGHGGRAPEPPEPA